MLQKQCYPSEFETLDPYKSSKSFHNWIGAFNTCLNDIAAKEVKNR